MFGKIFAFIAAVAAVTSANSCGYCGGYLTNGISGYGFNGVYGSRVLNAGCSVPVVSAVPACAPVAVPSQVVDPIMVNSVSAVAPVVSTGVVSSGLCGSGIYGSGVYAPELIDSGVCGNYGSTLGSCNTGIIATVI